MRAGELRHRIRIEEKVVVKDSFGAETVTWRLVTEAWAAILPLVGREFLENQKAGAELTTKIRLRDRSGVTVKPEMRATWGFEGVGFSVAEPQHEYNISAVIPIEERGRELVLMCREII